MQNKKIYISSAFVVAIFALFFLVFSPFQVKASIPVYCPAGNYVGSLGVGPNNCDPNNAKLVQDTLGTYSAVPRSGDPSTCDYVQWVLKETFTTPLTDTGYTCNADNSYSPNQTNSICEIDYDYTGTFYTWGNETHEGLTFWNGSGPCPGVGGGGGGFCGDNICNNGETSATCPGDCGGGGGGGSPDFSIKILSPNNQTVTAGQPATYNVEIDALNGMTGVVNLSQSLACPNDALCSVVPFSVTFSNGGPTALTASLNFATAPSTPANTYSVGVQGVWNGLTRSDTGVLNVNSSGGGSAPVNGTCGSSSGQGFSSAPSSNLCSSGSASVVNGGATGPWSWSCMGSNGGSNDNSCNAGFNPAPVNGTCGSSSGQSFPSAPSSNLCSSGNATAVNGGAAGPWTWSCDGANGGSNDNSCNASNSGGSCTTLTYQAATSGFSTNSAGPTGSTLNGVNPGDTFYAFVDYGSQNDAITPPDYSGDSGSNACVWNGWVGGSSVGSFKCVAQGAGGYSYFTNTQAGTADNICASGNQTIGTVTVNSPPVGPPAPNPSPTLDNSQCGQMTISWTAVGGATSYNIYRNTTGNAPVLGDKIKSLAGTSYTDAAPAGLYYYWVTAVNGSGESAPTAANNPSAITPCNANLDKSDKDITGKNGTPINPLPNACNGGTDALPAGTTFTIGDKISFTLSVCNNSNNSDGPASNIVITDTLLNVQMPLGGWGAKYNGAVINPVVSGATPNQTLTFTIPGSVAKKGIGTLTFNGQITVPPNFVGTSSRFQNTFTIDYNNGTGAATTPVKRTPLIPFSIGSQIPSINEIP